MMSSCNCVTKVFSIVLRVLPTVFIPWGVVVSGLGQPIPWERDLDFGSPLWQADSVLHRVPDDESGDGRHGVEWTIQASRPETARLDFDGLGIDLDAYDAIAFDLWLDGSDAMLALTLREWPRPRHISNWYTKIPRPLRQWFPVRLDLRLDDDGVFLSQNTRQAGEGASSPELVVQFNPRYLRFDGEPAWRSLRMANLRLMRFPFRIDFDKTQAEYGIADGDYFTAHTVTVKSRVEIPTRVELSADTSDLAFFRAWFSESGSSEIAFDLAPGEDRVLRFVMGIDQAKGDAMPPLYAERVLLRGRAAVAPEIDVYPLMGYRPWHLWGATPAFNLHDPTPAQTQAELAAVAEHHPEAGRFAQNRIDRARPLLEKEYEVLTDGPSGHSQSYICRACSRNLQAVTPQIHRCSACGKEHADDPIVIMSYLGRRHGEYMRDVRQLADAYQHSGDEDFARKARDILLQYADKYLLIAAHEPRSTAALSRLDGTTLGEAFRMAETFEAWHKLRASSSFSEDDRTRIERDFLMQSARNMMGHGAEMNQRAEYFKCFGTAGLYCRHWALAGEAIYGDQGFFSLFGDGFSEDGIAQEGGAYHRQTVAVMYSFAEALYRQGVSLYTHRLRRIFDAGIAMSPLGVAQSSQSAYEQAYRVYRNPDYLPTLRKVREGFVPQTFFFGVPGIPKGPQTLDSGSNLEATGYLFLRRNTSTGHRCLAINYGMQWERTERDRLHTHFYVDGKRIDRQVGRITYGSPFLNNIYRSFAHNLVTVDGADLQEERVLQVGALEGKHFTSALFRTNDERPLYEDVAQHKLVAILGGAFLVVDMLKSSSPRRYDWHYHTEGLSQEVLLELEARPDPPWLAWPSETVNASSPRWSWENTTQVDGSVGECRTGGFDETVTVLFNGNLRDTNVRLDLHVDGTAEILDGRIMAGYRPSMRPFLRVTRTETSCAAFAALYSINPPAGGSAITDYFHKDGVRLWRVRADGRKFIVGVNTTGVGVTIDGRVFDDALILYEAEEGEQAWAGKNAVPPTPVFSPTR